MMTSNFLGKLSFICGIVSLVLCFSAPAQARQEKLASAFNLRKSETALIKGTKLRLSFSEVNDSRCPQGVTCVWAGLATVTLDVKLGSSKSQRITLTTRSITTHDSKEVGSYKIALMAVNPYPERDKPTKPEDYVVTLLVSRIKR
jgi:hypothetical protein